MSREMDERFADDAQFDRLVDDELSQEQRRKLLGRLDSEPGGWRRCALAFLEAQSWKQACRALQEGRGNEQPEPSLKYEGSLVRPAVPHSSVWPGRLGTLLAMAASFLIVFWLGSLMQDMRHPGAGNGGQVAQVPPRENFSVDRPQNMRPDSPRQVTSDPWRLVAVSGADGPDGSTIRLPAVERNDVNQEWLQSLPSAIPDDVRQAFNRTGHQIEQHRQLVPMPLDDGRRLVVPVDQVDVRYIGNGSY